MGITKFILKKPVTCILFLLSIAVFGLISVFTLKVELTPEISMPMYVVYTTYVGASPEDVDKNIVKPLEMELYNLSGVKNVTCRSAKNVGLIMLEYKYGQNMDIAYNDLRKKIDAVVNGLDKVVRDSIDSPMVLELDMNSVPCMKIAVRNKVTKDIYNYVTNSFVKEIEKIGDVQEVTTSGGREDYVKIELNSEIMDRYKLSMSDIASLIKTVDFSTPGGDMNVGDQKLAVSTGMEFDTVESLKNIPITTGNGTTIYLEDFADIFKTKKDATTVGRYNGEDCMIVSIKKAQSASAVSVSKQVHQTLDRIKKMNPNVEIDIVYDNANDINDSINNVFQTMIVAIILSMIVIFIFIGDMKASLIIGTSIPFSILTALVLMSLSGFTLNLITMSALVLGVGMMVDNSIVVLEACFRTKELYGEETLPAYIKTVVKATKDIGLSVLGSTLTTVVVFAPLGFLKGMSGQYFKPLGFTIVYAMFASFLSSISVVPLCFVFFKPKERTKSIASGMLSYMQKGYKIVTGKLLKISVPLVILSALMVVGGFMLMGTLGTELQPENDVGMIQISIATKPALKLDEADKIYNKFEEFLKNEKDIKNYVLSNDAAGMSGRDGGQSLIVTLVDKNERDRSTAEIIQDYKRKLDNMVDCGISVRNYSQNSGFGNNNADTFTVIIEATHYDDLFDVNKKIVDALSKRKDVTQTTTSLDNSAPNVKVSVDPTLAAAEGVSPFTVAGVVNNTLSGVKIKDVTENNEDMDLRLEYPDGEYDSIEKLKNIKVTNNKGQEVYISDIADITFEDSPNSISKYNKKYRSEINAYLSEYATKDTRKQIMDTVIKPLLNQNVTIGFSTRDAMMAEEFKSLAIVIFAAIFLVFVVMAAQFESVMYSLMVMTTVLFSFIGAIVALWIADLKLSMTVFLGMLMLVGTAVNNGILYVDTVNQMRSNKEDLNISLENAGALRLRPIYMTTLTTIVSMIPMALAYGKNGETMQGLAVSDIGGLVASTIMALFILPCFYKLFTGKNYDVEKGLGRTTMRLIKNNELK